MLSVDQDSETAVAPLEVSGGLFVTAAAGMPLSLSGNEDLLQPLERLRRMTRSALVLLMRARRYLRGYSRIAGVAEQESGSARLAGVGLHELASARPGHSRIGGGGRVIVQWLGRPFEKGFVLVIVRDAADPPFVPGDLARVAMTAPWMADIAALWWRNERGAARAEGLRAGFGSGRVGAILLDVRARVIEANVQARSLLRRGLGLTCQGETLRAECADDDALLQQAMQQVLSAVESGEQSTPPQHLRLYRSRHDRPLGVTVLRPYLATATASDERDPAVLLLVIDPDDDKRDLAAACALFHLTPAETRLATALVGGLTVARAAKKAHVSTDTARTYLKQIFRKTGVDRQAALVRLLLNCTIPLQSHYGRLTPARYPMMYSAGLAANVSDSGHHAPDSAPAGVCCNARLPRQPDASGAPR